VLKRGPALDSEKASLSDIESAKLWDDSLDVSSGYEWEILWGHKWDEMLVFLSGCVSDDVSAEEKERWVAETDSARMLAVQSVHCSAKMLWVRLSDALLDKTKAYSWDTVLVYLWDVARDVLSEVQLALPLVY